MRHRSAGAAHLPRRTERVPHLPEHFRLAKDLRVQPGRNSEEMRYSLALFQRVQMVADRLDLEVELLLDEPLDSMLPAFQRRRERVYLGPVAGADYDAVLRVALQRLERTRQRLAGDAQPLPRFQRRGVGWLRPVMTMRIGLRLRTREQRAAQPLPGLVDLPGANQFEKLFVHRVLPCFRRRGPALFLQLRTNARERIRCVPPIRCTGRMRRGRSARGSESHPINSRIFLASAGLAPPVETATVTGPRCTMDGAIKPHSSTTSTTFKRVFSRSASAWTLRWTSGSSVAAMASHAPARSPGAYARRIQRMRPSEARRSNSGVASGLTSVTFAPEASSCAVLRSATSPPPTTTARRPGDVQICRVVMRQSAPLQSFSVH